MKKQILLFSVAISILLSGCKEPIKAEIDLKNDTLKVVNLNQDLETSGFYASENYVIAHYAMVHNQTDSDAKSIIDSLPFGQKIYSKEVSFDEEGTDIPGDESLIANERKNGFMAVYLKKPTSLKDIPIGYIQEKSTVEKYDFENYKKYFSLPEFKKLDSNLKRAILANSYSDYRNYYLTENVQKASSVIARGDFDGDGAKDYAFILDNIESQYSTLVVFLINKSTKEPYIAYKKTFTDFLKIKKIKKGEALLFTTEENQNNSQTAMFDGVLTNYDGKDFFSLLYNSETNKFQEFYR